MFLTDKIAKVLFFLIGGIFRDRLALLKPITAPFPLLFPSGRSWLWSWDPQRKGRAGERGKVKSKHWVISFGWCLRVGNQSSKPLSVCKVQCRTTVHGLCAVPGHPALSNADARRWEPLAAEVTTQPAAPRLGSASRHQASLVLEPPRYGGGAPGDTEDRHLKPNHVHWSTPHGRSDGKTQEVTAAWNEEHTPTCTHTAQPPPPGQVHFSGSGITTAREGGHQMHGKHS